MRRIGIFIFECLPQTETFIYEPINNLRNFQPHILTKVFIKDNQFNFNNHILKNQYNSSLLTDTSLYYLKPRYFQNNILRWILNIKDPFDNYIKKNNIQLLHAHFALDGLYALSLSIKREIPLIVSLHGGYDTNVVLNMKGFPKKEFFQEVDLFTVPCEHLKDNLRFNGCPENKIKVLHYGIRMADMLQNNIKKDKRLIKLLLVGRMTEKKGILDAISAFARLRNKYTNIEFTIISGRKKNQSIRLKECLNNLGFNFLFNSNLGYEKKVLNYIKYLNCKNKISIIQELPYERLRQIMPEYDVFILPSRIARDGDEEGMPLVLLEAQASCLPVVTTAHSGNPEAISEGKTGYAAQEGDVEGLVKRLGELIENEELRITMGRAGHEYVENNFSMAKHIENLENIYNQTIKLYRG